jgi:uncharacterized protein with HEPN domain
VSEREWRFYIDDMIGFAEHIRQSFPDIPWRQIIATRNQLIHGYLGIDADTAWSIIQGDLPALLPALQVLRDTGK